MTHDRTLSRTAGLLFFLTHVTSVGALLLYGPGGADPGAALAGRAPVLLGALLEVILAVGVVGTALALHPLLRDRAPGASASYVALRGLEAAVILAGVVAIAAAVAQPGSATAPALDAPSRLALVDVHAWTFLVGPGLICPVNTVVLAWALRRHGLVPAWIPLLGLGGAVLIGAVNVGVLFGVTGSIALAALPIFAWEISLATYLVVRGLRTPTQAPQPARAVAVPA